MRIQVHADAVVEDPKRPAIQPETGIAIEMRGEDALNVARETGMKKALNLARKYDLPTKTRKKMTKKAHDHDHAVAGVADVVEDGIVTTVEIENRLPSQIMTRIPF